MVTAPPLDAMLPTTYTQKRKADKRRRREGVGGESPVGEGLAQKSGSQLPTIP
jgi:hypothetical protein